MFLRHLDLVYNSSMKFIEILYTCRAEAVKYDLLKCSLNPR